MAKKKNDDTYCASKKIEPYLESGLNDMQKNYIQHRVMNQIDWYDTKAILCQKYFKGCMVASIILSAIIPVLALFADYCFIKILIAALSSATTAISAVVSLYHWRELWIQYRSNCELLQSVLHRYFARANEFNTCQDEEAFLRLIEECEEYMTKEFQSWSTFALSKHENQTSTGS